MSGKRHHFIPRFIQNGFSKCSKNPSVWVYRKNTIPFEANTEKSDVEKHFYSLEGDNYVDDEITLLEYDFAPLVETLRTCSAEVQSDPQIPKLLAHLETRTRLLRVEFTKSAEILSEKSIQLIEDEDRFVEFLKIESQKKTRIYPEPNSGKNATFSWIGRGPINRLCKAKSSKNF